MKSGKAICVREPWGMPALDDLLGELVDGGRLKGVA